MDNNKFADNVKALFEGMDHFVTAKTVVGDAIHIDDTIIVPLMDIRFGAAATAGVSDKKNSGGGGMGGKITPSAVLVIKDGVTKVINIKNQNVASKIMDMVPDVVNKFTDKRNSKENSFPENEDDISEVIDSK